MVNREALNTPALSKVVRLSGTSVFEPIISPDQKIRSTTSINHQALRQTGMLLGTSLEELYIKVGVTDLDTFDLFGECFIGQRNSSSAWPCPALRKVTLDGIGPLRTDWSLAKVPQIESLTLSNIFMSTLSKQNLADASRLWYLDLSHNRLSILDPEWAASLHMLEILDLSNNNNLSLPVGSLAHCPLKTLRLSGCGLSRFTVGSPWIETVDLSSNKLTKVPNISSKRVIDLILSDNDIYVNPDDLRVLLML